MTRRDVTPQDAMGIGGEREKIKSWARTGVEGREAAEHGRRQYEILELIDGKGLRELLRRDKGLAGKPAEMAWEDDRSDPGRISDGTPGLHAGIGEFFLTESNRAGAAAKLPGLKACCRGERKRGRIAGRRFTSVNERDGFLW